ncbi:MAG: M50 family metallopeptidase [Alphaproteobacteria bacterium]|nr:M50 family metallopeptidase [Alphaproteobacteria bacterium]
MAVSFRAFGVPFSIEPGFWGTAVALGVAVSVFHDPGLWRWVAHPDPFGLHHPAVLLAWLPSLGLAVLLHEAGHALAGQALGGHPTVELTAEHAITTVPETASWSSSQRILLFAAGSAAGLVAGVAGLGVYAVAHLLAPPAVLAVVAPVTRLWVWLNVAWGLVNLLPMLPTDGGQILQEIVDTATGRPEHPLTARLGVAVGVVVTLVATAVGYPFGAIVGGALTARTWRVAQTHGAHAADAALQPAIDALVAAYQDSPGTLVQRLDELAALRLRARSARNLANLVRMEAHLRAASGAGDDAAALLDAHPAVDVPPSLASFVARELTPAQGADRWWARAMPESAPVSDMVRAHRVSASLRDGARDDAIRQLDAWSSASRFGELSAACVWLVERHATDAARWLAAVAADEDEDFGAGLQALIEATTGDWVAFDRAFAASRATVDDPGDLHDGWAGIGSWWFHRGAPAVAEPLLRRLDDARPTCQSAYNLACTAARLGRPDEALAWLDTAAARPDDGTLAGLPTDEDFASLHGHPRFEAMRARHAPTEARVHPAVPGA